MTRIDRVRCAFEHQQPDRTPIAENLIKSPTFDVLIGRPSIVSNFRYRMKCLKEWKWERVVEQEVKDYIDLYQLLDLDMMAIGKNLPKDFARPEKIGDAIWRQGDEIMKYHESSDVIEWITEDEPPEMEKEKLHLKRLSKPFEAKRVVVGKDELHVLRALCSHFEKQGDPPALVAPCYSLGVAWLPSYQLLWFYNCPDELHEDYRRITDVTIREMEFWAEQGAIVFGVGGDLASDKGPIISAEHYDEFIMPEIKRQAEAAHQLGGYAVNTTDGYLWPILDSFLLGTNVDGYAEIDKGAGMEIKQLKECYGEQTCFIGNVDARVTLCSGTTGEVRREVHGLLDAGAGNGGHILMSSNCIHKDVNPENYIAMVQAYREHFGLPGLDLEGVLAASSKGR